MVNSEAFIKRLEKIINYYDLTAAAFAEKVEVQRSSISHILSGRNKPSLEFVLKVITHFPEVNLYWLLNGKGSFPEANKTHSHPAEKAAQKNTDNFKKEVSKVIIFYTDGTFETYNK
ncbi:helix-turn-helix transcriptional regulator [Cellulophaga omnivescoria]|uniref:helix-turn-helix transcriptional regulator n=1 Tax=Cellulophaga omnivescoria TaxID=1888890 RepID=UPI0009879EDF|nr:helix-turn-helix transcriptional regulator [Cellulophaga omnivescoria]WBU89155.1 helix-turn-helix transcriptional regulator [Cellulophaga omnivescoria]WKB81150.1 helix-turn-helix transcriptional regulator [Cellulophaga lytica]